MTLEDTDSSDILFDKKKIQVYFNLWHFIQKFYGFKAISY